MGTEDDKGLRSLVDEFTSTLDSLNGWLTTKVSELQSLKAINNIARQKKMPLALSQKELNEILLNTNTKWIVALVLPSANDVVNPFAANKTDKTQKQDLKTIENGTAKEMQKALMKTARRMFQQADHSGDRVGFLLTPLLPSPSPYRPTLTLFEDGEPVSSDFFLPGQPTNV